MEPKTPPAAEKTLQALEKALREASIDGRLDCAAAFGLARKFSVPTKVVGETANRLRIKISNCQLGCF